MSFPNTKMSTLFLHPPTPFIRTPIRPNVNSFSGTPLRMHPRAQPQSSPAPVMLLGIPRIFGSRPKSSELVEEVQTPPPPPPPDRSPVNWARAHPFQAVALAAVLVVGVQRALGSRAAQQPLTAKPRKDSTHTSYPNTSSSGLRAVPKRHETTEEALDLLGNTARKYIIVGGKGGVGKTSMSAAVATAFADRGQTTLIVSTDPAHSLSDAFGQNCSGGSPVPVMGIDNLYAQEVDPEAVKRTFKMMSEGGMTKMAGMDDMGLDELNSLFDTIPPGFDEAVALVEIVKYIQGDAAYHRFERIVFDTAPTGHTLRLLALPDFLNGFFGKIISMRSKFGNMMQQFKGMFGGQDMDMNASVGEMEELKKSMAMVRDLFRDEIQTEFVVATIPNMMAIAESKRLVQELKKEKIPVRHVFVNQVQPANDECTFCAARHKEQTANLKYIGKEFGGLLISTVQAFDKEIKGEGALRAMALQLFPKEGELEGRTSAEGPKTKGNGEATWDGSGVDARKAQAELVD